MNIPEDVKKLAEATLDAILCECTESCGGTEGLRQDAIGKISRAILTDREARSGGRDIASAPKDGTEFQGWFKGYGWEPRVRFSPDRNAIEIWGRVDHDIEGWDVYLHMRPTHWMPHPSDPSASPSPSREETETRDTSALLLEAEKALEPFGTYLQKMPDLDHAGNPLPDEQGMGWVYLNVGHFRTARSTLAKIRGEG